MPPPAPILRGDVCRLPTAAGTISVAELLHAAVDLGATGGKGGTAQLLALLYDDTVDSERLLQCLRGEPTLAARVLKVANSAYYRRAGTVGTYERALQVLGVSRVRAIAAVACMDRIPVPVVGARIDGPRFRAHSLAAACAAQALSTRAGAGVEAEGFMTGLLHDIGVVTLARLRPQAVAELGALDTLDEPASLRAESARLGVDQATVSAQLAEAWRLPDWLHTALRGATPPAPGLRLRGTEALPALLALANRCAHDAGYGLWFVYSGAVEPAWFGALGLEPRDCQEVVLGLPQALAVFAGN